jgi:hypothetical protein
MYCMWTLIITLLVGQTPVIEHHQYATQRQCNAALVARTANQPQYAAVCAEPKR